MAEAGVVPEESYINKGRPASVSSTPIAVEQLAVVAEGRLKPAPSNERVISARPEVQTLTTKAGVVLQRSPIEAGVPAPVSPSEKLHFGILIGTGEICAEPMRVSVEELQAFSAFCNEEFRSNASSNQASPPAAGTA